MLSPEASCVQRQWPSSSSDRPGQKKTSIRSNRACSRCKSEPDFRHRASARQSVEMHANTLACEHARSAALCHSPSENLLQRRPFAVRPLTSAVPKNARFSVHHRALKLTKIGSQSGTTGCAPVCAAAVGALAVMQAHGVFWQSDFARPGRLPLF